MCVTFNKLVSLWSKLVAVNPSGFKNKLLNFILYNLESINVCFRTTTINFDSILDTRIDEGIIKLACYFRVTLYLIWLNIPKYSRTDSHRILECSDQFKISSKVILRYLNELTRLISWYITLQHTMYKHAWMVLNTMTIYTETNYMGEQHKIFSGKSYRLWWNCSST